MLCQHCPGQSVHPCLGAPLPRAYVTAQTRACGSTRGAFRLACAESWIDRWRRELTFFCPPESALFDEVRERGYIGVDFCPGSYGYMMKRVLAMENDRVVSTKEGLRIKGCLQLSPLRLPLASGVWRLVMSSSAVRRLWKHWCNFCHLFGQNRRPLLATK